MVKPYFFNLASGSTDCTIRIWNLKNEGKELKIFIGHTSTVWTLVVLNNDNLASGSSDDCNLIWNMDGIKLREIKGHNGCILKLIVLNDGTLVSGSVDNSIRFWNPRNGKQLKLVQGHTDWILSLSKSTK